MSHYAWKVSFNLFTCARSFILLCLTSSSYFCLLRVQELRSFLLETNADGGILHSDWSLSVLLRAGAPFKVSFDAVYNVMEQAVTTTTDGLGFQRKLQKLETAVSILESFLEGVRAHRPGYGNVRYLDVKVVIDRVRVELQSIPDNIAPLESRLYDVEQAFGRFD
jgi:hypothetical protein